MMSRNHKIKKRDREIDKMNNDKMNNKDTYTFWEFLKEHSICIPIIQRDYAQGRKDKREKRRSFLEDIKNTLSQDTGSLPLYFVYGSFGEDKNKTFYPLDGQQRLTTLWLLHWYIAYKTDLLKDDTVKSILQKFSYATRVSARDFCKKLCELEPLPPPEDDIIKHIEKQNWFYSYWKQDPTIQSMLRMLNGTLEEDGEENAPVGIKSEFKNSNYQDYWTKLTSSQCIQFRVLDISKIRQTDDLYVKMNARGKPLTSFEYFKAELLDFIHKQTQNEELPPEQIEKWRKLDDSALGFGQKLDNDWTDIFWEKRSTDAITQDPGFQNRIDDIYYAFINRFWYNASIATFKTKAEYFNSKEKYGKLYRTDDWKLSFETLGLDAYLPEILRSTQYDTKIQENDTAKQENETALEYILSIITNLEKILNNFKLCLDKIKYTNNEDKKIYSYLCEPLSMAPLWEDNRNQQRFFIPEYDVGDKDKDDNGNEILKVKQYSSLPERCIFFAVCKFFENVQDFNTPAETLKSRYDDWLRVVWNIVENQTITNEENLVGVIRLLNELSYHIFDGNGILGFLIRSDKEIKSGAAKEQIEEERQKAKQIMDDSGNKRLITDDDGNITDNDGNLVKNWYEAIKNAEKYTFFHGCIRFLYRDANGDPNWADFHTKWNNARKFFDDIKGVSEDYKIDLTRRLLYSAFNNVRIANNYLRGGYGYFFNVSSGSWLTNLLKQSDWRLSTVHSILMHNELEKLNEFNNGYSSSLANLLSNDEIPLKYMINNMQTAYFKEHEGFYCFFDRRYVSTFYIDNGDWKRNEILTKIAKGESDIKICKVPDSFNEQFPNSKMFYGNSITLEYKNCQFDWLPSKHYPKSLIRIKKHSEISAEVLINSVDTLRDTLNQLLTTQNDLAAKKTDSGN